MTKRRQREYPDPAAVQLITHLSEGAYTTFAKAVKELVNNAFDADATIVNLDFDEDFSRLTLTDNGEGMSGPKFKSEFVRIAGSRRRIEERTRSVSRPIIGKFGIGFLSVARLCDKVTVYSKEKGKTSAIVREVPLAHFFDPERQLKNLSHEYYYYSLPDVVGQPLDESYTKIVLQGLRPDVVRDLKLKATKDREWTTSGELSGLDRFMWELGTYLPVCYREGFPVLKCHDGMIDQMRNELKGFNFRVFVNGAEVLKPICLAHHQFENASWNYHGAHVPRDKYTLFSIESPPGSTVSFRGYLYNQSKQIQPASLRGILLRVNHVGIKGYSKSLYEYSKNIGPIQAAISGEVFLGSDFEDVLTLDKDDFKEDHPLFKEVTGYIHNRIDEVASESRTRSRAAGKGHRRRAATPKVKDLNLSSREIKAAQRIVGKDEFKKEYFPNANLTIRTNIKNLKTKVQSLIGKSLDPHEADYLLESLQCFEADCRRGAIVMAWNTGIFRIYRKIRTDIGFVRLQNQIESMRKTAKKGVCERLRDCRSEEDLERYNERVLFLILRDLGLMDSPQAELFDESLGAIRNKSAHPTGHRPTDGEAVYMIEAVLEHILNDARLSVK